MRTACLATILLSLASGLGLVACAAEEAEPAEAVAGAEDDVTTSPWAKFYGDLAPAEMGAAQRLETSKLDKATLYSYVATGEKYRLQMSGVADASGDSIGVFVYDAEGHYLGVETFQQGTQNPHFFLQPFIPARGKYFLRVAAISAKLYPVLLESLVRVKFGNTALDVPGDTCTSLPTAAELADLRSSLPDATKADFEAAGFLSRTAVAMKSPKKLGSFELRRFERDESGSCASFGDDCGAWTESPATEVPEAVRTGSAMLARSGTSDILLLGSRKEVRSLRTDLHFTGSLAVSKAPSQSAKLATSGIFTPGGRTDGGLTMSLEDTEVYRGPVTRLGPFDGVVGKDCLRLFSSKITPNADGSLHRTVLAISASYGTPPPPAVRGLVVNEVMAEGTSGEDEFVELYNAGDAPVSLAGMTLQGGAPDAGKSVCFQGGAADVIAPKGRFVLGGAAFAGAKQGALACKLGITRGGIALVDAHGRTLDGLGWGTNALEGPVEGYYGTRIAARRQSLARRADGLDTNVNAADFRLGAPTPGAPNAQ